MKEFVLVVVVLAFAYYRITAAKRLSRKMAIVEQNMKSAINLPKFYEQIYEISSPDLKERIRVKPVSKFTLALYSVYHAITTDLLSGLKSKVQTACSILLFTAVASFFCFSNTICAKEAVATSNSSVSTEKVNQYGETAEEEAERKATESAQKEVVIKNSLQKAENQKAFVTKQKSHKKLREEISEMKESVVFMENEKTNALSHFGVFQNTILYDCVKGAYESAISGKRSDIADVAKEKKSIKNQMKSLKEEPKSIVFDPQDVTKESNISVEEMTSILEGTSLQKLAPAFVECEKEYGVNAIFLCGIAALESNWGNSRRAVEDNNYTGLGVYSDTAVGINSKTPEGNIHATAQRLAEHYLKEDGMFYNGLSVFAVNTKYCVGCTWGMKVTNIGYRLMDKVQEDMSEE